MTKSKEEQLIEELEKVTNYQILTEFLGGDTPSKADMDLINSVKAKHKINEGVMNVLIYYLMLREDMKMNTYYTNKVASHWSKKGIKTVREAMQLAKKERAEYLNYLNKEKAASMESLAKENEFLKNRVESLERDVYTLQMQLKEFRKEFDDLKK